LKKSSRALDTSSRAINTQPFNFSENKSCCSKRQIKFSSKNASKKPSLIQSRRQSITSSKKPSIYKSKASQRLINEDGQKKPVINITAAPESSSEGSGEETESEEDDLAFDFEEPDEGSKSTKKQSSSSEEINKPPSEQTSISIKENEKSSDILKSERIILKEKKRARRLAALNNYFEQVEKKKDWLKVWEGMDDKTKMLNLDIYKASFRFLKGYKETRRYDLIQKITKKRDNDKGKQKDIKDPEFLKELTKQYLIKPRYSEDVLSDLF